MHIFKYIILFLLLIFFIGCLSNEPIKDIKGGRVAYRSGRLGDVERLIKSTDIQNRDVLNSSVYYLYRFLIDLEHFKPNKKVTDVDINNSKEMIYNCLLGVYSSTSDINIKNICIKAVSSVQSQATLDFLSSLLLDSDTSIVEEVLFVTRPYYSNNSFSNQSLIDNTISILSSADMPVLYIAVENLISCSNKNQQVLSALENLLKVNKNRLITELLSGKKEN